MDTPELDRRRDELRCQGLQENLAKLGVEVSFEDLAMGSESVRHGLLTYGRRASKYRH